MNFTELTIKQATEGLSKGEFTSVDLISKLNKILLPVVFLISLLFFTDYALAILPPGDDYVMLYEGQNRIADNSVIYADSNKHYYLCESGYCKNALGTNLVFYKLNQEILSYENWKQDWEKEQANKNCREISDVVEKSQCENYKNSHYSDYSYYESRYLMSNVLNSNNNILYQSKINIPSRIYQAMKVMNGVKQELLR